MLQLGKRNVFFSNEATSLCWELPQNLETWMVTQRFNNLKAKIILFETTLIVNVTTVKQTWTRNVFVWTVISRCIAILWHQASCHQLVCCHQWLQARCHQLLHQASCHLLKPSQLLLHRQIEKLFHCRQLLHYQKLFHCHQLLHFQKLFHCRELLYYHQWLQVFSEVWLCELITCCIFETTFVWGSKVMRMLLALSSVSVTSSVVFCKVTDATCWRRFSKVLVKIVNQRSAPLLVTRSIPDASLLQSTAFWWVEQFWHLTEVPEISVMRFLQT